MHSITINSPTVVSKRLAITEYSDGRRKVQISSNLLDAFGMPTGTKVYERKLDSGGYVVELAQTNLFAKKPKHIYQREYKKRAANPFETVFETTSKAILESIPTTCKFVHVTMMYGKLIVKSVLDQTAERINKFLTNKSPFSTFSCLSSGIDAHAAQSVGFDIVSGLDRRPNEARDKKDLSESGMLSFLSNVKGLKHFFNEDIYDVSPNYVEHITKNDPSNLLTVSVQCCDFSQVKSKSLVSQSIENLTSTLDMIVPVLSLIDKMKYPMILLENVAPFGTNPIGDVWELQLRRKGYFVYSAVLDSREHQGETSRKRFFSFASSFPVEFNWPEKEEKKTEPLWNRLIEGQQERFRNVTHSISLQKGLESGRIRLIDKVKPYAPTPLRSQNRMCKDSVVIKADGDQLLFPDEQLLKELMCIPNEFNLDVVSTTLSSEIIGQAVDYTLYQKIMLKIKAHIELFMSGLTKDTACVA